MEQTFLFYDIETSGLNPAFDQIFSFACIRTGADLKPIDRYSTLVVPRADVIPSPEALLTHRLDLDQLLSGTTEYEAAVKIHSLLNQPGTISLGYNTMGFDDEFLRFTFYRNLLDPYTHQYQNGCSRMDIFPLTTLYAAFNPGVISWPQKDGKTSLKLEEIAGENTFQTSGRAHEAMNDVEATIELARRLRSDRKMWDYASDFFNKTRDEQRVRRIETTWETQSGAFPLGIMVSASFGADTGFVCPVIYIGESVPYPRQHLWVSLGHPFWGPADEDQTVNFDAGGSENLNLYVIRKRFGDQYLVLPALGRFLDRISKAHALVMEKNLTVIEQYPDLFQSQIQEHIQFKYPPIENLDPDAALYQGGFFTRQEKVEIQMFHQAQPLRRAEVVKGFETPRIKLLADRILSRSVGTGTAKHPGMSLEYVSHLEQLYGLASQPNHPIKGYKNEDKLTRAKALISLREIKAGQAAIDSEGRGLLGRLEAYLNALSV